MDMGTAITFASKDPDWWKKCLTVGLCVLIPVVGALILLGWQRRVFHQVRQGHPTPLPTVDIGADIQYGVAPLVASINALAILAVFGLGTAVATTAIAQTNERIAGLITILAVLSMLVMGLTALALSPELLRRAFADGEMFPLFKPGPSLAILKAHPHDYLLLVAGAFVANFLGSLGAIACYVGLLVTSPLGKAIYAHMLAQFDLQVRGPRTWGDQGASGS